MDNTTGDKKITKELYQKNLELVNANNTLELIRELYDLIIKSFTLGETSQRFIETIALRLGFSDGLVLVKDVGADYLRVVAVTQTQLNKTVLDIISTPLPDIKFNLAGADNELIKVFKTGKPRIVKGLVGIWQPYIKPSDISEISPFDFDITYLVYPILLGDKVLGVFAVSLMKKVTSLTEFEKNVLSRVTNVFGIAMERIWTNEELKITQLREIQKARELVRLKDEFVFIASHDLRTPVTAIRGFIDIIKGRGEPMSDATKDDFAQVDAATNRLTDLINDLLEVTRSESGTIKIVTTSVDVKAVIESIVDQMSSVASKQDIKIETSFDSGKNAILADELKLREVLENLISNAIKYNKKSGFVKISTLQLNDSMEINIEDSGVGIPVDQQVKVFQKFFRARQAGTEDVTGTGLGLFIVRMLVEKMGGKISFVSKEGFGTKFTINMPIAS